MAVINFAKREISCKIVYFGAAGAGCNTNVRHLHARLDESTHGRLHRFAPPDSAEATWYFELHKPQDRLSGFRLRFRIYSLPGGIVDPRHRVEVLREVDGVVFVADGRVHGQATNEAALLDLESMLSDQDIELAGLPVVLQVNHVDDPECLDASVVARPLNPYGFPVLKAAAKSGTGVVETLEAMLTAARTGVNDTFTGTARSLILRANREEGGSDDDDVVHAHLQVTHGNPGTPAAPALRTDWFEPEDEIVVPFQPRDFAGHHPVRILDANIDDEQVVIDLEFERMGGGEARGLRVRLANRPYDPYLSTVRPVSPVAAPASPILGVTDHLPDKIEFGAPAPGPDMHAVWYGVAGVLGGAVVGVLIGFLLFN